MKFQYQPCIPTGLWYLMVCLEFCETFLKIKNQEEQQLNPPTTIKHCARLHTESQRFKRALTLPTWPNITSQPPVSNWLTTASVIDISLAETSKQPNHGISCILTKLFMGCGCWPLHVFKFISDMMTCRDCISDMVACKDCNARSRTYP